MPMGDQQTVQNEQLVVIGTQQLEGILAVPAGASGLVIFAHGSGSSRFSPRNSLVAEALNRRVLQRSCSISSRNKRR